MTFSANESCLKRNFHYLIHLAKRSPCGDHSESGLYERRAPRIRSRPMGKSHVQKSGEPVSHSLHIGLDHGCSADPHTTSIQPEKLASPNSPKRLSLILGSPQDPLLNVWKIRVG